MSAPSFSLAELVATLALAADTALGHPLEQGLGTAIVATGLAGEAGLARDDVERVYHQALLRHIGCTSERDQFASIVGDEFAFGRATAPLSGGKGSQYMRAAVRVATAGKGPVARAGAIVRMAAAGRGFTESNRATCEVAQLLASRLGFDEPFTAALGTVYERWDGRGFPNHVKGEDIPLTIRLTQVADLAAALHDLGHGDVVAVIRSRAGTGFDPEVVALFARRAPELLRELDDPSRWGAVLRRDPGSRADLAPDRVDEGLAVVADFSDLQCTHLVGHSSGVAALAAAAAERCGMPASDVRDVRLAALVHDLGRVGVSARIWAKRGSLTAGEWEDVRLHPYHTERILSRAPFLARLAAIASLHHERLDGTGYFRGVAGLPRAARVLAAADVYHAMTEPRPHRPAMAAERAAAAMQAEVRAGRLDRESVDAVLESAGHRTGRRKSHLVGLTAREVEVLRLLARGLSTKDIGRELVISAKTAENHIASIYTKANVTTRAAATVFAMQHGLMDTLTA